MLERPNITQTTLRILGLYNDNYLKSLHLREIARKTKTDVNTVYPQLNKLEEMNILSSTMKGKNKEYVLNLDNIVTKYYLTMTEIFTAIDYLQKNFVIKKVMTTIDPKIDDLLILFGSFVKGGYTKESDIDMFVIADKKLDKTTFRLQGLTGHKINAKFAGTSEFVKALKAKDPLVNEVVANHIVLKGADKFCDIMWRRYGFQ